MGFVEPDFIAKLSPFNILSEHVWHYHSKNLFTLNQEIYNLLKNIEIDKNEVIIKDEYKVVVEQNNIYNAVDKLQEVFRFLNKCFVYEITAIKDYTRIQIRNRNVIGFEIKHIFGFKEGEGITKNINLSDNITCDCISCSFRSLDFKKLLQKLKAGIGYEDSNSLEYAFGNYLTATNNFKTTYQIYKSLEKKLRIKEGGEVEYFIVKKNIKYLQNLILDYELNDSTIILDDIKSIDLDKTIYDEVEYKVDENVKEYLIRIKEDGIIIKLQDKIEEIIQRINKLKKLYEDGGKQYSGPNLYGQLYEANLFLYFYVNGNYIIFDTFSKYRYLVEKSFKGFVTSYLTPEFGLQQFNEFILTETILHVSPNSLQIILKKIDHLNVNDSCINGLIQKLFHFVSSYFNNGLFNKPYKNVMIEEQLLNLRFRAKYTDIFANLFTILGRLEITKEKFTVAKVPLLKFLNIEDELSWFDLNQLGYFIRQKGYLFEVKELEDLLKTGINREKYDTSKYASLIDQICETLKSFYPKYKLNNSKLIYTAIINNSSEDGNRIDFKKIICLLGISNKECRQILIDAFERELDKSFNETLYESLLRSEVYDYTRNDYFQFYCERIQKNKGRNDGFDKLNITNYEFINFILIVYHLNIDLKRKEFQVFIDRNDFENWLLNPSEFNYQKFDVKWLIEIKKFIILDKVAGIKDIKKAIDNYLHQEYNSDLAEIKYKYFSENFKS